MTVIMVTDCIMVVSWDEDRVIRLLYRVWVPRMDIGIILLDKINILKLNKLNARDTAVSPVLAVHGTGPIPS